MKPDAAFPVFFFLWILLCVAVWTFYWKGSLEAKRRWHPRIAVGIPVLFLGLIAIAAPFGLAMAIPAVAVISLINLKSTRFCPACGRTLFQSSPWSAMNFCPKCGASLRENSGA